MSKGPVCPFIKKACMEHECMLYTHITMVHDPQTGASKDEWACALALIPILLIENARQTRNTSASVDSMRNHIVERMDKGPVLSYEQIQKMLPEGKSSGHQTD